ncbi:hypothetical protein EYF80_039626 [Liparis tanakae]|uniref:Uncharacterized protein n=1 Tax=Liparis tanakae TaxID=230148 RepID=A0A4Z2GC52_9TELE|nr:hypothetical protein EYF80_039626 [Liparis tanakae]
MTHFSVTQVSSDGKASFHISATVSNHVWKALTVKCSLTNSRTHLLLLHVGCLTQSKTTLNNPGLEKAGQELIHAMANGGKGAVCVFPQISAQHNSNLDARWASAIVVTNRTDNVQRFDEDVCRVVASGT